jgi:hypothetical protein
MTTNPDRLGSSPFWKSYATSAVLGADVNLNTDGGGPCRGIRVGVAGNLAVTRSRDGSTEIIYNVAVGELIAIQATALVASGSTAEKITVFW